MDISKEHKPKRKARKWRGVLDTTTCEKFSRRLFCLDSQVTSTNAIRHDMTEIMLKVALNTDDPIIRNDVDISTHYSSFGCLVFKRQKKHCGGIMLCCCCSRPSVDSVVSMRWLEFFWILITKHAWPWIGC